MKGTELLLKPGAARLDGTAAPLIVYKDMDLFDKMMSAIYRYARASHIACHYLLAAGSSVIIFSLVIMKGNDFGAPYWATLVAAYIAGNIWYRAIEDPLRRLLVLAWAYQLTDEEEKAEKFTANHHRAGKTSGWLSVLLVTTTLSLSLFANFDITDGVTDEQDSSKEIAQAEKVTSSYDADVSILKEQLETARTQDAKKVSEAKAKAAAWLEAAKNSQGPKMRRLYDSPQDEWAKKQLASAIAVAKKRGEKHVDQALAADTETEAWQALNDYITTRSASRDTVNVATASIVSSRRGKYTDTVTRRNWALGLAVVFVVVIYVFSTRFYVIVKLSTNNTEDENDHPGFIATMKNIGRRANQKLGNLIDHKVSDKWLKIVPVSVATTSTATTTLPPTASAKPVAPTTVKPVATIPAKPVARPVATAPKPATSVVGQQFEQIATSCTPEDIRRYKDQFRHCQERQFTSARAVTRQDNRVRYEEAVGVLSALGYTVAPKGETYRQTHNIEGVPTVVTFEIMVLK